MFTLCVSLQSALRPWWVFASAARYSWYPWPPSVVSATEASLRAKAGRRFVRPAATSDPRAGHWLSRANQSPSKAPINSNWPIRIPSEALPSPLAIIWRNRQAPPEPKLLQDHVPSARLQVPFQVILSFFFVFWDISNNGECYCSHDAVDVDTNLRGE